MYRAVILRDSISRRGHRLTTFEIEFPRIVLAEVVTHRLLYDSWGEIVLAERTTTRDISKNSASSRAIPLARMLERVLDDPYIPERFGINEPGMQASGHMTGIEHDDMVSRWLAARDRAIAGTLDMLSGSDRLRLCEQLPVLCESRFQGTPEKMSTYPPPLNSLHKQDINRLIEPWAWVKQVVSATQWANFFALRCDRAAHPAFARLARMMFLLYRYSAPQVLEPGDWHLPYVRPQDHQVAGSDLSLLRDLSAARCAWTSYWPPDGVGTPEKVARTLDKLKTSRPLHGSPMEHQATPMTDEDMSEPSLRSNLMGWLQYRKLLHDECVNHYEPSAEEAASWGIDERALIAAQHEWEREWMDGPADAPAAD